MPNNTWLECGPSPIQRVRVPAAQGLDSCFQQTAVQLSCLSSGDLLLPPLQALQDHQMPAALLHLQCQAPDDA